MFKRIKGDEIKNKERYKELKEYADKLDNAAEEKKCVDIVSEG